MFGLVMLLVVTFNLVATVWMAAKYAACNKQQTALENKVSNLEGNVTTMAEVIKNGSCDAKLKLPSPVPVATIATEGDMLAQAQQVLDNATPEELEQARQVLASLGLGDL